MNRLNGLYADKESFHEWILSCCDTLVRNEDKLYNSKNRNRGVWCGNLMFSVFNN